MKLVRILITVFILLVIGLVVTWKLAPNLIGSTLSSKMGVEVTINNIDLSQDQVKVQKLEISNPSGSKLPNAFTTDSIKVSAPLTNYVQNAIVINEIALDKVYLSLEFTSPSPMPGNWSKILDNLKKSSGPEEKPKKESKSSTSVLIKKLVLKDINVELVTMLDPGKVTALNIPQLEFTDVSSDSGVPLEQIITVIIEQTVQQTLKQSPGNLLENVIKSPAGLFEHLLPIK